MTVMQAVTGLKEQQELVFRVYKAKQALFKVCRVQRELVLMVNLAKLVRKVLLELVFRAYRVQQAIPVLLVLDLKVFKVFKGM